MYNVLENIHECFTFFKVQNYMAQQNKIYLKRSSVTGKVPTATQLAYGELAINYTDGKLFYKDNTNVVKSVTDAIDTKVGELETKVTNLQTDKLDVNGTAAKATADANGNVIASTYVKGLSVSGRTITYTKGDGTPGTITTQDTTYADMKGATATTNGVHGLVPAPASGKQLSFLRGDGNWAVPTDTTYEAANGSTLGLVKIGSNITNSNGTISITKDNVVAALGYTPPTTNTTYGAATSTTLGLVKTGSNITNTSGTISLTKANVTAALGYTPPTTNTTYDVMMGATSSVNGTSGLVPAPAAGNQAKYLRGDGTWNYPTDTKYTAGAGITVSGTTIVNGGVRSVKAGTAANQIVVDTNGTSSTLTVNNVANATRATSADKLTTARNIALTGNVVGSASFNGSANVSIKTSLGDSITAKNLTVTTSMKLPSIVEYDTTTKITTRTIAANSRSGHYAELASDARVTIADGVTWAIDC